MKASEILLAVATLGGCSDPVCNDVEAGQSYAVTVTATEAFPSRMFDPPGVTASTPSCGAGFDLSVGSQFTVTVAKIGPTDEAENCLNSVGYVREANVGGIGLDAETSQRALSPSEPGLVVSQNAKVGSCSGVWTLAFWGSGPLTTGAHLARGFSPASTTGCEAIPVGGSTFFPRCEDAFTVSVKKH